MKRPPSSDRPQSAATPHRQRSLNEEERVLWDHVARQIKPLRKKPAKAHAATVAPEPPAAMKPVLPPRPVASVQTPKPSKPAAPPLAPLGRRERSRLSRGHKEIDARLDLHGMTQTRAHRALAGFLHRAHSEGLTFVLIITGKGKVGGAETERGVLRRQVPLWLALPEFRPLVVGFEEAHIGHGGEGALYVRIRRSRIQT